jgi:hypothetical protein
MNQNYTILLTLSIAAIASGCVSNSTANLNQNFDTEAEPVDSNLTGTSVLNDAFTDKPEAYEVESKTRILFNTPVTSVRMNLSSSGEFLSNRSNITTSTRVGLGMTNETADQVPEKTVETSGNTSTLSVTSENGNTTTEAVEAYNREDLGVSLEAFEAIEVQSAELLGATGENNSRLLVELETESSDLVENYESVMTAHAVNDEESSMENQDSLSEFNTSKAYAWVGRDERNLERYSYYGSAVNGALQVRMDARFTPQ